MKIQNNPATLNKLYIGEKVILWSQICYNLI